MGRFAFRQPPAQHDVFLTRPAALCLRPLRRRKLALLQLDADGDGGAIPQDDTYAAHGSRRVGAAPP